MPLTIFSRALRFLAVTSVVWATAATPLKTTPIDIQADRLQVLGVERRAIWRGNVKAKRGTTDLACEQLIALLRDDQSISKLQCIGSVEVTDRDKYAKGDRADFDNLTGVLQVTGSAQAKQGPTRLYGTKVTIDVNRDRMYIENPRSVLEPPAVTPKKKK
jgi:lipopolysaccharide export system protein LptA